MPPTAFLWARSLPDTGTHLKAFASELREAIVAESPERGRAKPQSRYVMIAGHGRRAPSAYDASLPLTASVSGPGGSTGKDGQPAG